MQWTVVGVVVLTLLSLLSCGGSLENAQPADLVLRGGRVVTVAEGTPEAEALAVRGGFIEAVGADEEIAAWIGEGTRVIDLEGRLAIPGLIDFFTIEKYVVAMLPKLATERENVVVRTAIIEFERKVFLVGAVKAAVTLAVISVVLLTLTTFIVRWREYSSARALGG